MGELSISRRHWVHTWTAMPMLAEPDNLPPAPFVQNSVLCQNTTLRQTLKISLGTDKFLRLRFSNAFGATPLPISQVTVALAANNASGISTIKPETIRQVTFDGGARGTTISTSALTVSDPIDVGPLAPHAVLSVSVFLENGQEGGQITSHPGSRTTSFFSRGNHVNDTDLSGPEVKQVDHWYYISGVEVYAPATTKALAIIGDSITDGRCSTTNGNDRWPNLLFPRLQANPSTSSIAILNQASGGNRVTEHGLGPNVLSRIDRDILSLSGVEYVMIYEGVNDIGVAAADEASQLELETRLIAAYRQIATRVHAHGLPILGATITPFGYPKDETITDAGAYSHPLREKTRQRVNNWIRTSGVFDAVVDFDAVLRDEVSPECLKREFDSGDHLHPNTRAFEVLADAFPLSVFETLAGGFVETL